MAQPYTCVPAGRAEIKTDKARFKIYFADITGRAQPELYEWAASGLSQEETLNKLLAQNFVGPGFIIAFPHITKVYRFNPENETNIDVRAFKTSNMSALDLERGAGFVEFACLAESIIAAAEHVAWAEAPDVEAWLKFRADLPTTRFVSHDKLRLK